MVRLFGRVFTGLLLNEAENRAIVDDLPGAPGPLAETLRGPSGGGPGDERRRPQLANIYGFSFEGHYYKMAAPAVFLVHGPGAPVVAGQAPIPLSQIGVAFKDAVFAEGVRMWGYDKLDHVLRIDISSGWLQDILLDAELGSVSNMTGDADYGADLVGLPAALGRR